MDKLILNEMKRLVRLADAGQAYSFMKLEGMVAITLKGKVTRRKIYQRVDRIYEQNKEMFKWNQY